jgi:hexosaminidase
MWNIDERTCETVLVVKTKNFGQRVQALGEDESYSLVVDTKQVLLKADNALGVMRGLQTLLQLAERRDRDFVISAVSIQDSPRFSWRGLMIDVCRHWMPVEMLKRNLDGMEAAKLNVLHLHLSDDQGFRVESKRYPELQAQGSDGGFYTQEELRQLVAYARDRGIRVVPEFDMPGHCTAWITAYPGLGSGPGPYVVEHRFGIFDPTLDPSSEVTYKFIDGFLGEMAGLFPDACVHIGGDENDGKEWNANPRIQAFMAKHGYRNNDELQAYFSGRVAEILTKHGKRTMGWDELLHADVPKDSLIQAWHGYDQLQEAAQRGYDSILSEGFYLDLGWTAAEHYLRDPLPAEKKLSAEAASHVIGGEACLWAEMMDEKTVDSRIWPRALAVAERLWSPPGTRDVADLYRRMEKMSTDMDALGLLHHSYQASLLKDLAGKGDLKALTTLADAVSPIRYYKRHGSRDYKQSDPMNRLVDAVVPDGPGPRRFDGLVRDGFAAAPDWSKLVPTEAMLKTWSQNHKVLGPMLASSDRTVEAYALSEDLSALGDLGLEALKFLKAGNNAPEAWQQKAAKLFERAVQPKAELELTVLPGLRKMVFAASQVEKLKAMGPTEWNKDLDAQTEKASQRKDDW